VKKSSSSTKRPKPRLAEKHWEEMRLAIGKGKGFSDLLIRDADSVRAQLEQINAAAFGLINGGVKHARLDYVLRRSNELLQTLREKEFCSFGLLAKGVFEEVWQQFPL
jgi:hypothetical protein